MCPARQIRPHQRHLPAPRQPRGLPQRPPPLHLRCSTLRPYFECLPLPNPILAYVTLLDHTPPCLHDATGIAAPLNPCCQCCSLPSVLPTLQPPIHAADIAAFPSRCRCCSLPSMLLVCSLPSVLPTLQPPLRAADAAAFPPCCQHCSLSPCCRHCSLPFMLLVCSPPPQLPMPQPSFRAADAAASHPCCWYAALPFVLPTLQPSFHAADMQLPFRLCCWRCCQHAATTTLLAWRPSFSRAAGLAEP